MLSTMKLFEQRRFQRFSTYNAPEFIYSILYDKESPPMRGRGESHKEKNVSGISVDSAIPDKAIKDLLKIKEIETRSSCQGSDEIRPTFLIFRPKNQDSKYVKKIVDNLNSYDDIKAGYNVGREGSYRIGVTTSLWPEKDKKKFETWWLELPNKIQKSL
ncbi:MAG: hypothetical protein ACOC22_02420 [bacterium]